MDGDSSWNTPASVLEHLPGGVVSYQVTADGRLRTLYFSPGVPAISGHSSEEYERDYTYDASTIVYEHDRHLVQDALALLIEQQQGSCDVSYRIWHKNGSLVRVHAFAAVAGELDGCPVLSVFFAGAADADEVVRAAQSEQQKARIALEQSHVLMWEYDLKTLHARLVTRHASDLELPLEAGNLTQWLIDHDVIALHSQADLRAFRAKMERGDSPLDVDVEFVRNGASSLWIRAHYEKFIDAAGNTAAIGCAHEVTGEVETRRLYEGEIKRLEQVNTNLLLRVSHINVTSGAIDDYRIGHDMLIRGVPASYGALIDAIDAVCVSEGDRRAIHDALDPEVLLDAYLRGKTACGVDYCIRLRDTSAYWVHSEVSLYTVPGESDVHALFCTRDINTERLIALIVDRLVSAGFDNLALIDVSTGVVTLKGGSNVRIAACRDAAHDFDVAVRGQVESMIVPESRDEALAAFRLAHIKEELEDKTVFSRSYRTLVKGAHGYKKWDCMYLDDSRSTILFMCSDVTDVFQQQMQQAEKLNAALDEAHRAMDAKTMFFAQMSHDIRTPLNAILGSAALINDDPSCALSCAQTIQDSGNYLLSLINDILDVSKAESDGLVLSPAPCYASEFVGNILSVIKPMMDKKHIEFEVEMGCGVDLAMLDGRRLSQLFYNLLSNAAKYTPEGGHVRFWATSLGMRGSCDLTRFVVEDDGIGMSAEFQKKLFMPFSREHANVSEAFEWRGTGLGLAIVKRIVDAMGGQITVESELGRGSKFIVDLPILPLADDSLVEANDAPQSVPAGTLKGVRVLLAEDNEVNADIARRLFENQGMVVTVVDNGAKAVEAFRGSMPGDFDIILLDMQMPVMGGLEAARTIRALRRTDAKRIPIAAMTANAFEEDRQASFAAGMTEHLVKPFVPQEVFAAIAKLTRA